MNVRFKGVNVKIFLMNATKKSPAVQDLLCRANRYYQQSSVYFMITFLLSILLPVFITRI